MWRLIIRRLLAYNNEKPDQIKLEINQKATGLKDLFVIDDIEFSLYDDLNGFAFNPRNQKCCCLSYPQYELLKQCDRMLTVDLHIKKIIERKAHAGLLRTELEEILVNLKLKGMVLTAADIVAKFELDNNTTRPDPEDKQSWKQQGWTLAVGSADRPELLARMLKTAEPFIRELEVRPRFIMVDDSRVSKNQGLNKQAAEKFSRNCELEFEYWDRDSRSVFSNDLIKKLPDCKNSIQYLLSPQAHSSATNTIGQVRNLILLRALGKPLLMLDDDCLINPVSETDYHQNGLKFAYSGRNAGISASIDELFLGLQECPVNPFKEHLEVLETSVQDQFNYNKDELLKPGCWQGILKDDLHSISANDFVGMSINAIAGALNARPMSWVFKLENHQQQQAIELIDKSQADTQLEQAAWVGSSYDELGKSIGLIGTTICGIACLPLIPPLIPVGRNEDIALGETIKFIYPQSRVYMFAWGLPHLPEPKRYWNPLEAQTEPAYDANPMCMNLIEMLGHSCAYVDPGERLSYLAASLRNTIGGSAYEFIRETYFYHHSHELCAYDASSKTAAASVQYQRGCEQMQSYHMSKLDDADTSINTLLPEFESVLASFSQALEDWPEIWHLCSNKEWQA